MKDKHSVPKIRLSSLGTFLVRYYDISIFQDKFSKCQNKIIREGSRKKIRKKFSDLLNWGGGLEG